LKPGTLTSAVDSYRPLLIDFFPKPGFHFHVLWSYPFNRIRPNSKQTWTTTAREGLTEANEKPEIVLYRQPTE
jgi:hypothetical protein